ncbi:MAG: translation initiation factor IF-2 [Patescibacteria group bacterium]
MAQNKGLIYLLMNTSVLARQLKVTTAELLEKLPSLGFDIGVKAIKVDDKLVPKIIEAWKKSESKEAWKKEFAKVTEISVKEKSESKADTKEVAIGDTVIVKDMAASMNLPVAKLMAELMKNGIMVSLNEKIDFDTATIIAEDLGFKVTKKISDEQQAEVSSKERLTELLSARSAKHAKPPVVVVMGHVDHGKTKLLDAIRQANVVDQEAGGITQHIGAYQVKTHNRTITFLDTPGHEAFKAMRSRGGQIADVAILVVAADDGLQPQTLESISVIQKESLPFIVAINKIDKAGADIDRVKQGLSEINLIPEDWGGKTICQPISALKKEGISELLDMILLIADMENLKADEHGPAVGTIIESNINKNEGPVATVLVQAGTLKIGDTFIVGQVPGKIKTLKDWQGRSVTAATPAMPVKILGLKQLPQIGEILEVINDKKLYKEKLKNLNNLPSHRLEVNNSKEENSDSDVNILNLIIKSDVLGSAEAIEESLQKISVPGTRIKVLKKGLGLITETDVLNAAATNALLIGFHIKENKNVQSLAAEKNVNILYFDIIYKLLEDVARRLETIRAKKIIHKILGKLEVLAIFKTDKNSMIFGGKVIEGKVTKKCKIKVIKKGELEAIGTIANLQSARENVNEVVTGNEAGIEYRGEPIVAVGDTLEFFEEIDE